MDDQNTKPEEQTEDQDLTAEETPLHSEEENSDAQIGETQSEDTSDEENDVSTEEKTESEEEATDNTDTTDEVTETPTEDTETKPAENLNDVLADKAPIVAPDNAKWFIVHTYAGHENKVSRSLKQRVESMGFQERIFEVLVPTRKTVKIISGKKQEVEEKIFAGYVFVQMILDEETWLLVRTTQGVTAFIGPGSKPTPIPDKEVEAILKFMKTEQPMYKTGFIDGDVVKITDGPFADFEGTITHVDQERGKVKVTIMIFDRETPVELDFLQVQKL